MSTVDPESPCPSFDVAFAAGDERFLAAWVLIDSPEVLLDFLSLWLTDGRPWARQQIESYLNLDLNLPGHEVVVKRLVRHFEATRDHAMMARFMVTFDRLVRRRRTKLPEWNCEAHGSLLRWALLARPNRTVKDQTGRRRLAGRGSFGRTVTLPDLHNRARNRLFSHRTRNHLRRRVWRYFRWLSYSNPSACLAAVTDAIILYREEDVGTDDCRLDNWSLMHACCFESPGLMFSVAHANFETAEITASLTAAPYQPALWKRPEAAELLIQIMAFARSSFCRAWARELLQRDHAELIRRIVECDRRQSGGTQSETAAVERWCSDLLSIHERGLAKRRALTAIRAAILEQPNRSGRLLPILAVAVRSASASERRHALAAVATMREQEPQLRHAITTCLPELEWDDLI